MRILHVTRETEGDRRFGLGRSLLPVCQALEQRGHVVQYLTQQDLSARARDGLQPIARWLGRIGGLRYGGVARHVALAWAERLNMGRMAALLARQGRFDVVHLHDPWMTWGYRMASKWHGQPAGLRWGFTEHGFGAYADATHEEGLPCTPRLMHTLRHLEARLAAQAHWVICPTASARAQLARDLSCLEPARHWHAVPHARPQLRLPARDAARNVLGMGDRLQVLAVGRINPVKRLEAVVQACIQMGRPMRLTLLAGGADPAALHALAAAAPQLELEVREVDDVAPYLAAADVYVSAARNESFGMANLEAMVAGLPIVCTAVGGVPDVVGPAAWLVAGGDAELPQRLAHAVLGITEDASLRQRLAHAAAERGARWPDAAQIGERYEAIYRGLV